MPYNKHYSSIPWDTPGAQEHPEPVRAPVAKPPPPVHATDDVPKQACLPDPVRARSAKRSTCGALSLRMLPIELIQVTDGAHSLLSIMLRVRHLWRLDCERQAGGW